MRRWRIEDSAELYNITGWGLKYFSINDNGHVQVTPREGCASVDLKELMDELQIRDITAPVLLRFPDKGEPDASGGRRNREPRQEIQHRAGGRLEA